MIDYCSCCVYYTQLGCDSKVTFPYGADEDKDDLINTGMINELCQSLL